MKIVNREEFMKLPPGVFYAKGKPQYFGGLEVKHETCYSTRSDDAIDWWSLDLSSFEFDSTEQFDDRFEEMQLKGVSYPLTDSIGRDGLFDQDDIFLIYEKPDLEALKAMIEKALSL